MENFWTIPEIKLLRLKNFRTVLYRKLDTFIALIKFFTKLCDLYDTVENNVEQFRQHRALRVG